jgi:GNAT superfamily N-acetyltransferase
MNIPIRELAWADRAALLQHFRALAKEDRRLRFGTPPSDYALREYVARLDFDHDAVFGVADEELFPLGVAHVARNGTHAELGISVLEGHRNRGIGGALLARAYLRARNWGVRALFMHCLTENATIMRLARRQGMEIVAHGGEADAWLALPPAMPQATSARCSRSASRFSITRSSRTPRRRDGWRPRSHQEQRRQP